MIKRISILSCVLCLITGASLMAQTQYTGWIASFNTIRLSDRVSIHNDMQLRGSNHATHLQTFLLRGGLNYRLNKRITVTAGYAYIGNRRVISQATGYSPEHRTWQQLLIPQRIGRVYSTHRPRTEQRFIGKPVLQGSRLKNDSYGTAQRFRYFMRHMLPLRKQAEFERGTFVALQNELFLNYGNRSNVNGKYFDQNRFYFAAGYRLHASFDLEAGYMNQYINGRNNDVSNHIFQVAGYLRI